MKTWVDSYTFDFPWETVVQAAYRKYPTRHNTNVKTLDTLERRCGQNGSGRVLFSHRLFGTLWNVPALVINVSLRSLFKMSEVLQYKVHPEDPSKTILQQHTVMSVHGVPLLGGLLETMILNSYESVISKGRLAIEEKAKEIKKEL
ncbi:PREDICTED: PRELI domain containing protein 3B-like isoform X2 [Amphimedon queenslandica]|uniref:PRELI/MSF1 domain-containing protein n=1 Tax=Amphimedon queenslandica TaxID=400682 RepID=A0AAN0JPJ4_AMPQE|nr:PREDICTED: PRELI domain containing protein 3B-like isoform X2 [Amphimedon queenslandica]|eukprot:XP_019858723.1 PREDICTED: PRELI domain containing protein 3B-like isoform X2 [Amphimedon queenslandica]